MKRKYVAYAYVVLVAALLGWSIIPIPIGIGYVAGNSMYPSIKPMSVVLCVEKQFSLGDIVVVKINEHYVVHRVVFMNSSHVQTRGDNNPEPDPVVPRSNVRFVVVAVIPPPYSVYFFISLILSVIGVCVYILYTHVHRIK